MAARRVAVAPRAARLLVVGLDALGDVVVDHVAHIGLVDAHAERIGGDYDGHDVRDERLLVLGALAIGHARVVAPDRDTARPERVRKVSRKLIDRLARGAVHDAALVRMCQGIIADPGRLCLVAHLLRAKVEIGAIEARHHRLGVMEPEHLHDVGAHALGGRCRKGGEHGALGKLLDELRDMQVGGPKILAPLTHAVRLVDRDERKADAARRCGLLRKGDKARILQALGCHVHDLVAPLARTLEDGVLLTGREHGVEVARPGSHRQQGARLVGHERDERAHHDRETLARKRRHLVADRFAGAGGHHAEGVAAGENRLDHALLPRAERVVAKVSFECRERPLIRHAARPSVFV